MGLIVYVGQLAVLLAMENRLVYPGASITLRQPPPDGRIHDVELHSADGTPLHAWHFANPEGERSLLFLHGNGCVVCQRGGVLLELGRLLRASVLMVEYPGYGQSGGSPSEAGCYAAADAGYDWLTADQKVPAERLLIVGESLGGGVAVDLARRRDHRALVLLNTFSALPDVGQSKYPWLPVRWLMRNRFDSLAKVGDCRRPVFQAHGTDDWIVPFGLAERLFEAVPGPKRFVAMPGHGHNDPLSPECLSALREFVLTLPSLG
jgi:fermentation-respiration switch protein FrsA (DUF1100 family)